MSGHQWLGKTILSPDHAHDLERAAAIHEFGHGMLRHEAEKKAYDDYVRDQRLSAMAHHYQGMKAAYGLGDMDEARKHGAMYELHAKSLGFNPTDPVPPEVVAKMPSLQDRKVYKFKTHGGDAFALKDEAAKAAP